MNLLIRRVFLLAAVFLIASPLSAFAHGDLTLATPAANSTVIAAPSEVSLEFDGKLQTFGNTSVNEITVKDDKGQVISEPTAIVNGTRISTKLIAPDITGLITVHYRIVSEDGHPVEGDYSFTIGQTPTLTSAGNEEIAESANEITGEDGGNLLVNGVGALIVIGAVLLIVRRFKK